MFAGADDGEKYCGSGQCSVRLRYRPHKSVDDLVPGVIISAKPVKNLCDSFETSR